MHKKLPKHFIQDYLTSNFYKSVGESVYIDVNTLDDAEVWVWSFPIWYRVSQQEYTKIKVLLECL